MRPNTLLREGQYFDGRRPGSSHFLSAERVLFLQLSALLFVMLIAPITTIHQATTTASNSQLILRVGPVLAIGGLALLPALASPQRSRFLSRAPVTTWIAFCVCSSLGGLALGRYPVSFTVYKSAELLLPILAIASSTSRCSFEAAQRVVFRILELLLLAVAASVLIRPSGIKQLGGLIQLNSDLIKYPPNKLAIGAAIYLILAIHNKPRGHQWRIAFGAAMVALALSRSVLGILFVGAPYLFAPVRTQKLRSRIRLTLLLVPLALVGNEAITNIATKGGTVAELNITSVSGRTFKWGKSLELIREWPYGWGINGAFRDVHVVELSEPLGNVHSSALESFLAAGLLGGIFWVLFWIHPLRRRRRRTPHQRNVTAGADRAVVFVLVVSLVDSGFVLFTINLLLAATLVLAQRPLLSESPEVDGRPHVAPLQYPSHRRRRSTHPVRHAAVLNQGDLRDA